MGYESPSNREILNNSIGFYVPSVLFFIGRFINALFLLKRLQLDDYLMCLFFSVYTALLIFINISAHYATNLFPPDQLASIMADPSDVANRVIGSIIVIPLEQCMLLSTWGVKVCLLIFLYRMTNQMPRTRIILWLITGYVALGYVLIQVCYYAILCRPFHQYYAMPVSNPECATYSQYSKIQMSFNISSDLFIILLPTCILWRSRLPLKRKLLLMALFSLGIFTIVCAILNKFYNFASPETTVYQLWYIREASVAMWVGNLICCWQLAQLIFNSRSADGKHSGLQNQLRSHDRISDSEDKSVGGHTKNTAWYDAMIEKVRRKKHDSGMTDGETMVNSDHFYVHDVPLLDRDASNPPDMKDYGDNTTIFSLTREEEASDAGPAISYRRANNIL